MLPTHTAIGTPARLSHPDGDATCLKLVFRPKGDEVWLWGDDDSPAIVRSVDQGKMIGNMIYTKRAGDRFEIKMDGEPIISSFRPVVPNSTTITEKSSK